MFNSPGFRLFARIAFVLFLLWYYFVGIPPVEANWLHPRSWLPYLVDAVGFALVFFGGLGLISQFVLPVQTPAERRGALGRLRAYAFGRHGPVVFVKDGALVGRKEETGRRRRGFPGLMLLDSGSAAVLEKPQPAAPPPPPPNVRQPSLVETYISLVAPGWWEKRQARKKKTAAAGPGRAVRAVGPGIALVEADEKIVDTLDLRKQVRVAEVTALTLDGIEVTAPVIVVFALDPGVQTSERDRVEDDDRPAPLRPDPAYPFSPESAFRAVYGSAMGEKERVHWSELPAVVAAERFRDLLSQERLDDLFRPSDPATYPFQEFVQRLGDEVKGAGILLQRGIKVFAVVVGAFSFPEQIKEQRIRAWSADWERRAIETAASGDAQAQRIIARAQAEAYSQMIADLSQTLEDRGPGVTKETIAARLSQALDRAASEPSTRNLLGPNVLTLFEALREGTLDSGPEIAEEKP